MGGLRWGRRRVRRMLILAGPRDMISVNPPDYLALGFARVVGSALAGSAGQGCLG